MVVPLRGGDDRLAENLREWLDVAFPGEMELIAVADSDADRAWLALDAAERGRSGRRFRRLIATSAAEWLPKVRALQTGLEAAQYPRLVFANSDVRITAPVLAEVVARSRAPGTAAAYAHPVFVNARGLGSVLDAAVTNFTALIVQPLLAIARLDCVAGDLWAASAEVLHRAHLFGAIHGEIADDLTASRRLRALGLDLQLCSRPVETQRGALSVGDFYRHQLMWLRIWHRDAPLGRATALLFSPLAWAIAAGVLASAHWPVVALVATGEIGLAAWIACFLNRQAVDLRVILATPLALLGEQIIALVAPFGSRVSWVDREYRLGREIAMLPPAARTPPDT